MTDEQLMSKMDALGYCYEWLAFGFIGRQDLDQQYARLGSGDGTASPEHFRFESFQAVLADVQHLDEDSFERLLLLIGCDPDEHMAKAALHLLIDLPELHHWQADMLATASIVAEMGEADWLGRANLLRSIRSLGATEKNCQRALDEADGRAQRELLETPCVPAWYLEKLATSGANKKVRNMAISLLRRKSRRRCPKVLPGNREGSCPTHAPEAPPDPDQ